MNTTEHDDFVRNVRSGAPEATSELFHQYANRLIGLARKHIEERNRAKVDPDDIAQSVFRTFFRRTSAGEFDIANEDALWALLAQITIYKCGKWNRHFRAGKRDSQKEVSIEALLESIQPEPQEAGELSDLVERVLSQLDDRSRTICELRLQGYQIGEIAYKINCAQATVYRDLNQIRDSLSKMIPEQGYYV